MATLELIGSGSTGWGALLLLAALITLCVTASALAIGAVLGAIISAAKLSGKTSLVALGNVYTTVFRGVPELLIIYLIYFGGSSAVTSIGKAMGYEGFLGLPSFLAGALAVGIISGAYQAEVFPRGLPCHFQGRTGGGIGHRHASWPAVSPNYHPPGAALRNPRPRQRLAAQPEGSRR